MKKSSKKEDSNDGKSKSEKGDVAKAVGVASVPSQKNWQIGTNASISSIGAAGHDSNNEDNQVSQVKSVHQPSL